MHLEWRGVRPGLRDSGGQAPVGWCAACGGEIYEPWGLRYDLWGAGPLCAACAGAAEPGGAGK